LKFRRFYIPSKEKIRGWYGAPGCEHRGPGPYGRRLCWPSKQGISAPPATSDDKGDSSGRYQRIEIGSTSIRTRSLKRSSQQSPNGCCPVRRACLPFRARASYDICEHLPA
jgi:hypothetical protein